MVLELVEADPAQPFAGDGAAIGDAAHFEAELDVLGGGAPRHHAVAGEHVADVVADAVDLGAVDFGKARARLQQAGDDVEQGRLAATRRADDGDDRAVRHVERHAAHRLDRAAVARPEYYADIRQADFRRRWAFAQALLTAGFQRNSRASTLRMMALNSQATTASVTRPANTAAVLKFAAPEEMT